MNYEWIGKTIKEKLRPKKSKNSKNKSEMAACEHKITSEKAIFVQTPFSHNTLNLVLKHFNPQNHSRFRYTSSFGATKITTPI